MYFTSFIEHPAHTQVNTRTPVFLQYEIIGGGGGDDDLVGYEPTDLTVHPPPKTIEGGFIFFSYRCLVFPKKCPQRKACTFRSYLG